MTGPDLVILLAFTGVIGMLFFGAGYAIGYSHKKEKYPSVKSSRYTS